MKQLWENFMTVKGYLLEGIYANKLDTYKVRNDIILHSVEPLLSFRKNNSSSSDIKYWKVDWIEDNTGDDILLLKEQETPEPLEYELIDNPFHKHIIMSSSFSVPHTLVKKVSGYGFKNDNGDNLYSIVLELDDLFITIETGAVITIKITSQEPGDLGDLIFSA
ncbi:hypothetical protein SAMN04487944_12268 [Gracilibacillus ureilyticus]|uniref:Uncharacterized protein n=1 Tax=Gracilibacillus ureilyticus TaxID=531814 RepID=A0A1H9VBH3_9BACI|nr:hypothetical protein [Gracilibacillus ureilyticus]SES18623.1 hypothetical protein SAMN04487944_12268 [Gracilibacillus ureilyticus]